MKLITHFQSEVQCQLLRNYLLMAYFFIIYIINKIHLQGESYASSLPLQMLLYFNLFYFPLWLLVEIVALYLKVGNTLKIFMKIVCISKSFYNFSSTNCQLSIK